MGDHDGRSALAAMADEDLLPKNLHLPKLSSLCTAALLVVVNVPAQVAAGRPRAGAPPPRPEPLLVLHAAGGSLSAAVIDRVGRSIQRSSPRTLERDAGWTALFKRALKKEGIAPDAAKLDCLCERFQMPYQLAAHPGYYDTGAHWIP